MAIERFLGNREEGEKERKRERGKERSEEIVYIRDHLNASSDYLSGL